MVDVNTTSKILVKFFDNQFKIDRKLCHAVFYLWALFIKKDQTNFLRAAFMRFLAAKISCFVFFGIIILSKKTLNVAKMFKLFNEVGVCLENRKLKKYNARECKVNVNRQTFSSQQG